jgi:mRNA-degrading endonuclease RelE of RelBE toxin-antitoxin system
LSETNWSAEHRLGSMEFRLWLVQGRVRRQDKLKPELPRIRAETVHGAPTKRLSRQPDSAYSPVVRPFQIIFNPTSAAELGRMPKELQLQILGEFRGLPQQVIATELDDFGKLERGGKTLHRFRVGDYRVYFERHDLGVLVHRILSRNTLKDFLYRSGLKVEEDEALQQNPKFWEMIESAKTAAKQ